MKKMKIEYVALSPGARSMTIAQDDARLVTVCAACLTASCWHGEFMCSESRYADITKKTVAELDSLHREHPDNYSVDKILKVYGSIE